jgi:hypothetical protein
MSNLNLDSETNNFQNEIKKSISGNKNEIAIQIEK